MAESSESEGDWAVAQFDVTRLAHDTLAVGDGEVGEATVILFEPIGALRVGLARHLCTEISELLAELFDLGLGFEVLEGMADGRVGEANGDGMESTGLELRMPLHDVEVLCSKCAQQRGSPGFT